MTAFRWQLLLPLLLVGSCHGQGQSLAGGRFQTTTDVTSWYVDGVTHHANILVVFLQVFLVPRLNLANDAADMRDTTDSAEKKDIYLNVSTISCVV